MAEIAPGHRLYTSLVSCQHLLGAMIIREAPKMFLDPSNMPFLMTMLEDVACILRAIFIAAVLPLLFALFGFLFHDMTLLRVAGLRPNMS